MASREGAVPDLLPGPPTPKRPRGGGGRRWPSCVAQLVEQVRGALCRAEPFHLSPPPIGDIPPCALVHRGGELSRFAPCCGAHERGAMSLRHVNWCTWVANRSLGPMPRCTSEGNTVPLPCDVVHSGGELVPPLCLYAPGWGTCPSTVCEHRGGEPCPCALCRGAEGKGICPSALCS